MDLSSAKVKPYSDLVINDPTTGEPTDIVISVYGKDSKFYRDLWQDLLKVAADKKSKGDKEYEALALDMYIKCTKSWQNVDLDGKPLECTYENVKMIYEDEGYAWLHEQVLVFMESRANFI